jgi:hypothetical protein
VRTELVDDTHPCLDQPAYRDELPAFAELARITMNTDPEQALRRVALGLC